MAVLALLLLFGVALGPPFGDASATAVPSDPGLTVTVEAEISAVPPPDVVVVHVVHAGEQQTYPLAPTGADRYAGNFPAPAANVVVAFEAGWGGERYERSEAVTLADLGVEPDLLGIPVAPVLPEPSRARPWILLAFGVAAAAAAAGLMLYARRPAPPSQVESRPDP
jgi:hypothetical protein